MAKTVRLSGRSASNSSRRFWQRLWPSGILFWSSAILSVLLCSKGRWFSLFYSYEFWLIYSSRKARIYQTIFFASLDFGLEYSGDWGEFGRFFDFGNWSSEEFHSSYLNVSRDFSSSPCGHARRHRWNLGMGLQKVGWTQGNGKKCGFSVSLTLICSSLQRILSSSPIDPEAQANQKGLFSKEFSLYLFPEIFRKVLRKKLWISFALVQASIEPWRHRISLFAQEVHRQHKRTGAEKGGLCTRRQRCFLDWTKWRNAKLIIFI